MDHETLRDIQRRLRDLEDTRPRVRIGEVTATSPLSVALGGSATAFTSVKTLTGQTYNVNDQVACLMWAGDLIVLGVIT